MAEDKVTETPKEFLTLYEAVEMLGLSRKTIYNLMKIVRITDFCWFHEDLDPVLANLIERDHHLKPFSISLSRRAIAKLYLMTRLMTSFCPPQISQDNPPLSTTILRKFFYSPGRPT